MMADAFGTQMMGGVSKSKNLNAEVLEGVVQGEAVSTQVAEECNHGLLVETMKAAMFKLNK